MKFKITFLAAAILFASVGICQYTPLPKLDETEYNKFIATLRVQAEQQDLPELNAIADKMTYDEARRFIANPQVFAEKLKEEQPKEGATILDAMKIGIIVNLLFNHLTGLPDGYKSNPKIGYAFGLYALFTLGTVYLMSELLFSYQVAGSEIENQPTNTIYKISYLTLFATMVYAIQMQKCRWLLGAGPVFAFGLSGKEKWKDYSNSGENELNFDNQLTRFQAGLTLMTGFMLSNGMLLYLSYCYLFTDVFQSGDVGMNLFRLGFGIPLN
jgi:hypothetical protein